MLTVGLIYSTVRGVQRNQVSIEGEGGVRSVFFVGGGVKM